MPHLKDRDRLGDWAFGKFYIFGSKDSDRSGGRAIGKSGIRPLNNPSICDRPPRLTHTHTSNNTTYYEYDKTLNIFKPRVRLLLLIAAVESYGIVYLVEVKFKRMITSNRWSSCFGSEFWRGHVQARQPLCASRRPGSGCCRRIRANHSDHLDHCHRARKKFPRSLYTHTMQVIARLRLIKGLPLAKTKRHWKFMSCYCLLMRMFLA